MSPSTVGRAPGRQFPDAAAVLALPRWTGLRITDGRQQIFSIKREHAGVGVRQGTPAGAPSRPQVYEAIRGKSVGTGVGR